MWVIGRKGELYYREAVSKENPGGTNWKLIESPKSNFPFSHKSILGAKSVSLSKCAAWVVMCNGTLAVRTDVSKDQPAGKQWKYLSGENK